LNSTGYRTNNCQKDIPSQEKVKILEIKNDYPGILKIDERSSVGVQYVTRERLISDFRNHISHALKTKEQKFKVTNEVFQEFIKGYRGYNVQKSVYDYCGDAQDRTEYLIGQYTPGRLNKPIGLKCDITGLEASGIYFNINLFKDISGTQLNLDKEYTCVFNETMSGWTKKIDCH
jgi:hypothetical protein